jgi:Dolichyl-phosphate-mannose-protein mannosyltransferase
MFVIQFLIHKFETFTRARVFQVLVMLLAALLLGVAYDLRNFKNMSTQEAMDTAQLARNISEGKGYTTLFIRPFSLFLIKRAHQAGSETGTNRLGGSSLLKIGLPDISNAPVYPCVLAGLMKVVKFNFAISSENEKTGPFWGNSRNFQRYRPDFVIAVFNQMLLLAVVVLAFLWTRKLFDAVVAWSSAVLLLGTEVLWRFSVSGLSTLFLMLLFMLLVWCLTLLEIETREPGRGPFRATILTAVAGVLLGIGGLTRYSFAWLIFPAFIFIIISTGPPRRAILCLTLLLAFAAVMTPWLVRNYNVSGAPFGTATYSALEDSGLYPDHQLERSLDPNLRVLPRMLWTKLFANLHTIRQTLAGTGWMVALFATGLLIGFNNLALRRVRYFVMLCLGTLLIVQAVGRTHLSVDSPEINSENLLVLLLPIILIYAVSFFCLLLDRLQRPAIELRIIGGLFGLVACLSMILALLKPEATTLAYPPYYPPTIQQTASWMKKNELMMSDIPWAVAWYGNQQCVWLTLAAVPDAENSTDRENLLTLNHDLKPVSALYLTPLTIDSRLLSECVRSRENGWGKFVLRCLAFKEVPESFPLHEMPAGFLPEQLFLSDSKRWQGNVAAPNQPSP